MKIKAWIALREDGKPKQRIMVDNCFAIFPSKKTAKNINEEVEQCEIIY